MAQYMDGDPRLDDPMARIAFVKITMARDADQLAHAFEVFAQRNAGDAALFAFLRRMGTCLRDFHTHIESIFTAAPPKLTEAIDQTLSLVAAPFPSIKTTKAALLPRPRRPKRLDFFCGR
jgi:hypothetical protein